MKLLQKHPVGQSLFLAFLPQVTFQKSTYEAVITFLAGRKRSSWPFRKLICRSLFANCSEHSHCFEHLFDWLYWKHNHHYISPVSFFHSATVDESIGIVMLNCWGGTARCPWRTPELWLQVICEGHFQMWFICRKEDWHRYSWGSLWFRVWSQDSEDIYC